MLGIAAYGRRYKNSARRKYLRYISVHSIQMKESNRNCELLFEINTIRDIHMNIFNDTRW